MRSPFLIALSISSVVIGTVIVSLHSAVAQPPARTVVARQPDGRQVRYVMSHDVVDVGHEEAARLGAQEGQLAGEAEALARQLADATEEKEKDEIKEQLRDTLSRQFDVQQKARELEVARIEAKVKKLREMITKRNDARRTIIDKRLDQLSSEAEGLGWNSPSGGGPPAVYLSQTGLFGGGQPVSNFFEPLSPTPPPGTNPPLAAPPRAR